ncbi:MAG: endonuclease/exonuclease/phosphatase family protein [Ardenticatenales bacterium]|nr:endonuclease/exonuclease/phosphatase family protein [Ardenticatenales bacterium]
MSESDLHQFNVVTLNAFGVPTIRTRARLRTIARELNDRALNAVCLQEVQLQRYVPVLSGAFSNFPYASWEPHLYAPKGGLMTLTREPQSSGRFIPFRNRGWLFGPIIADRMLHKGMLVCRLEHRGLPITLINTHLAANYSGNWERSNRYAKLEALQLAQLAEVVNEQPPESLIVVVGDFNIPRYSWLYEEFLTATRLHDPLGEVHDPTYRPHALLPAQVASMLNIAIDHALIRVPEGLAARYESVIILRDKVELVDGSHAHLSDHYGIHLRIEWPKAVVSD